jgi:hypothetical protein
MSQKKEHLQKCDEPSMNCPAGFSQIQVESPPGIGGGFQKEHPGADRPASIVDQSRNVAEKQALAKV